MNLQIYTESINKLVFLARGGTDESRAAAQVLLSTADGESWQVNIEDLCLLDPEYYEAAMQVIRGRVEIQKYPQYCIDNGEEIFSELCRQWQRYHVENRGKPICSRCNGTGQIPEFPDDEFNYSEIPSPQCGGGVNR